MKEIIRRNFNEALDVLQAFMKDENKMDAIAEAGRLMVDSIDNGGKIISCGNGGSMADAMHFAEELTGRFRHDRPAIPAVSISDPTHMSCVANDFGYDYIFSRYVEAMGKEGDVLLAISTSGNSANILKATEAALQKGMKVVALTGKGGGSLSKLASVEIRVEGATYSDRIQEVHIKVIHTFMEIIEKGVLS